MAIASPAPARMAMRNLQAQVLESLGAAIASGQHPPGTALPVEGELCTQFGVSRTVIREVIKSLVAKGMLTTGPKVGTRVCDASEWNWFDPQVVAWQAQSGLSKDVLRDLQELRRLIEPAAASLAAQRATPSDLNELLQAYEGMRDAVANDGDYVSHDLRFHQGLLKASHNQMIRQMSRAMGALLLTSFELSSRKPGGPAQSLPLHFAVLQAIQNHDPQAALEASLQQIDVAKNDLDLILLSRRKPPDLSSFSNRLMAAESRRA
jgi:DNA-binding FadR family transcriptional regulator